MKPPKIVVIGAGSLFFGRQAIWSINNLPGLKGGTLSLVDTNPERLEKITRLAHLVVQQSGSQSKIESHADFRDALPGADFVVLSFSDRNAHFRRIDCQVSAKYGIRMCSGDTIGPGGVFRAMRELPKILEVAHAVEELCPQAWLINYVNPSAVIGIGLHRHSSAKTFALCDIHHMPGKKESYFKMLGEPMERFKEFDCRISGVNHFTWMLKAELNGTDVLPKIREAFRAAANQDNHHSYAKARFNNFITAQLADVFGAVPTCTGHTKEYVPYYQGHSPICEPVPPLSLFDATEREEITAQMWENVDEFISGRKPISEFHEKFRSDHATDVIHTMVVEDGRTYYINRANSDVVGGTGDRPVGNLPADAILELECQLDRNGPRPLPVGDFPLGLRSMQMQILDVHELTVEAIVKRDRDLLVRALAIDPLVSSIATAEVIIDELFELERDALPGWPEKSAKRDVLKGSQPMAELPQQY